MKRIFTCDKCQTLKNLHDGWSVQYQGKNLLLLCHECKPVVEDIPFQSSIPKPIPHFIDGLECTCRK